MNNRTQRQVLVTKFKTFMKVKNVLKYMCRLNETRTDSFLNRGQSRYVIMYQNDYLT